ncbi:MAG: AmmeMemoRadiSam system protein A [Longimicrobiales bacterium]
MVPSDSEALEPVQENPPESVVSLGEREREILRQVALDSIRHGLTAGSPLPVTPGSYPAPLEEPGAVFVTLELRKRLRGCIGSYLARRPLVKDVAENAFAAAFRDPRFPPLAPEELQELEFHISLLTPPVPMEVESREELLAALRPGVDGLLLEDPPHRSTFLPQVWEALPDPKDFLDELLRKGGLRKGHWSPTLRVHRYTVQEF